MPMFVQAASPEAVNTLWSRIPGGSIIQRLLGYIAPTNPSSQVQSMVQPMEAPAMGLAHLLPGLASVLPETRALAERLGVPIREISDWATGHGGPGIYTGYRAAEPAKLFPVAGERAYVPGGTFFTKEPLYARQYLAQKSFGGGPAKGAGKLYRVEGAFGNPLNTSIPEHRNLLAKLQAIENYQRYKADKLAHGETPWYSAFRDTVNQMRSQLGEKDPEVVKLPPSIVQGLLQRGYDAIVMPRELEGAYPTAIGFGGPERMIAREIPRVPATKQSINAYRTRKGTVISQNLFNRLRPDLQEEVRRDLRRHPPKGYSELFERASKIVQREMAAGRSPYRPIGSIGQFQARPIRGNYGVEPVYDRGIRVTHLPSGRELTYGPNGQWLIGHSLDSEGFPWMDRDFGLGPTDVMEILRRSQPQP